MKENVLDVLMYLFETYIDAEEEPEPDQNELRDELSRGSGLFARGGSGVEPVVSLQSRGLKEWVLRKGFTRIVVVDPLSADVAGLVREIRDQKASAVFAENIADSRLVEQIASEAGLSLGGTLYSDALSEPDGPAPTYVEMMRANVSTITQAIAAK